MDNWFGMVWFKNGKSIMVALAIVAIVAIIAFVYGPVQDWSTNTNNPKMYEDEMIVSIDDYKTLVDSVIVLQESMQHLLAGEPQSPELDSLLTTEQEQFMCIQNTEDYKDGFLEISTILNCMNLQLTE